MDRRQNRKIRMTLSYNENQFHNLTPKSFNIFESFTRFSFTSPCCALSKRYCELWTNYPGQSKFNQLFKVTAFYLISDSNQQQFRCRINRESVKSLSGKSSKSTISFLDFPLNLAYHFQINIMWCLIKIGQAKLSFRNVVWSQSNNLRTEMQKFI